ncbi:hypothetical protein CEXT_555281 [Caerostris extrusa]|uniref:Uncharacterized protein n=1 Tax=Caerostris extrusa TaxID=172846 RepID=A0AAV4N4Y7_CAEEX|nr:hypothetical protein CEXT_555281 [Caerostris extrusa]
MSEPSQFLRHQLFVLVCPPEDGERASYSMQGFDEQREEDLSLVGSNRVYNKLDHEQNINNHPVPCSGLLTESYFRNDPPIAITVTALCGHE